STAVGSWCRLIGDPERGALGASPRDDQVAVDQRAAEDRPAGRSIVTDALPADRGGPAPDADLVAADREPDDLVAGGHQVREAAPSRPGVVGDPHRPPVGEIRAAERDGSTRAIRPGGDRAITEARDRRQLTDRGRIDAQLDRLPGAARS